jgi:hypothetical protein
MKIISPLDLLNINGNFDQNSMLVSTARDILKYFTENKTDYVIIDGLAVIRNGALRTTDDIDILMNKTDWLRMKENFALPDYKT